MRFPLNLNVLDENRTPLVMSLKETLSAWLKFQIEVLVRKSQVRIEKIDDRLELLEGFLIAFLNLDRVIEIIRTQDEPKPLLMAEFSLTDRQAEAILNMRLRSLRRLEEMEIGREREKLAKEREELVKLVAEPSRQRRRLKKDLETIKQQFGDARRTRIEEGAPTREIDWSAMIEKEPITVILSQRGSRRSSTRRRPIGWRSSPPTAASTRLAATSFPEDAASASRCACPSTWTPKSTSWS